MILYYHWVPQVSILRPGAASYRASKSSGRSKAQYLVPRMAMSMIVPLFCYLVVVFYEFHGYRAGFKSLPR
jgi:hypothetical protein